MLSCCGDESHAAHLPVVGIAPPNTAADGHSNNDQSFPDPQRQKHNPVIPLNNAIQAECKQKTKYQQACIDYKLATTTYDSHLLNAIKYLFIDLLIYFCKTIFAIFSANPSVLIPACQY